MILDNISVKDASFRFHDEVLNLLTNACSGHPDICSLEELGRSEEGRRLVGIRLGRGPLKACLLAGAHADEPVGPESLRTLILKGLEGRDRLGSLFERYTLYIVPHVNPDGEERNRGWIEAWPDPEAYLKHAVRELPGRDVEFNYPAKRIENGAVSGWLASNAPYHLHMSLHGMGFSDGAMLLIEKNWTYRTGTVQEGFTEAARLAGLRLHDHNRKGEKGFFYIAPGFTTTPEGTAMRTYFRSHGDETTAALFGDSSMEFVRSLGGDPLCMVTELPLFIVDGPFEPFIPTAYLAFKSELPEIRLALQRGDNVDDRLARYGLNHVPIAEAVRIQLRTIELGLEAVE